MRRREATSMRRLQAALIAGACIGCGGEPAPSWLDRLAPLEPGAEVVPGWVLEAPSRGFEHDVVLPLSNLDGQRIEVHIVDAGRWASATPAGAYGVDWEEPHTTGPREVADAARDVIAATIRPTAEGAPPVDDVRIGNEPPTPLDPVIAVLQRLGHRPVVPGFGTGLLALTTAVTLWHAGSRYLMLAVGAWLVRFVLGAWGPLHANGQGNLWIRGAGEPALLSHYGPGYAELYGVVARGDGAGVAVFGLNSVLAAAIPAVAAWVVARRGNPRAAGWVGVWLALDPVAVRIATTETYLVPAALTALLAAARPPGRTGDAWVAVLAAFAARLHPTAWPLIAISPALCLPGTRRRSFMAAFAGAAVGSGVVVADVLRAILDGRLASPAAPPHLPHATLAAALALALWRRAPAWWGAGVAAVAWASLRGSYGQSTLWQAAFDAAWSPWLAIGAALVLTAGSYPRFGPGIATAAVLARGASLWGLDSTDAAEHRWVGSVVQALPPDCAVAWVARADDVTTAFLPVYTPRLAVAIDARGSFDVQTLPAGCVAYVHASACATASGARRCDKVEEALGVEASRAAQAVEVVAKASHDDVQYATPTVSLWWTRVR
jgi:hypothetical protein